MVYSKIVDILQGKIERKEMTKKQAIKAIIRYKHNLVDYKETVRQFNNKVK